jgi:hypothetical protein
VPVHYEQRLKGTYRRLRAYDRERRWRRGRHVLPDEREVPRFYDSVGGATSLVRRPRRHSLPHLNNQRFWSIHRFAFLRATLSAALQLLQISVDSPFTVVRCS